MPSLHGNVSLHPSLRQWDNFGLAPVYVLLNGMQTVVVPCPSGTALDFSHAAGSFLSAQFLAPVVSMQCLYFVQTSPQAQAVA